MYQIRIIILIFSIPLMISCNWDIEEKYYPNYITATQDKFSGNGYIPQEFFKKSINGIYLISNIDSQEFLIKFRYSDSIDWIELLNMIKPCEFEYAVPETFRIPKWWDLQQDKVKLFCFRDKYESDFFFAIDLKKRVLYSWDNYKKKQNTAHNK